MGMEAVGNPQNLAAAVQARGADEETMDEAAGVCRFAEV